MTQTDPSSAPALAAEELPRWTAERMSLFIRALARTRNVAAAARAAGMSRQAAYRLRARLPGHPFDRAWAAAMAPRTVFRQMTAGYGQDGTRPDEPGHTGLHRVTGGDTGLRGVTQSDTR